MNCILSRENIRVQPTHRLLAAILLVSTLSAQSNPALSAGTVPSEDTPSILAPIELLLETNREIQAATKVYEAATARIRVAGTLPDPMLEGISFIQPVETRNGPTERQIMLGQKFPLWGKLRRQRQIASDKAEIAAQNLRSTQVAVVFQMRKAWENYLKIEHSLKILHAYRDELESFRSNALAQYSTGGGITQHPILKLQIEISLIESKINSLESELESIMNDLQSLFDGMFKPELFASERTLLPPSETDDFWLAQARQLNPGYKKMLLDLEIATLQHELAKRKNYPDLVAGVTYTSVGTKDTDKAPAPGTDAFGVKVGLNIPLWFGRNKARVRSTQLVVGAKNNSVLETWNRVENRVRSTIKEQNELEETYLIYEGQLVQESEQMLASAFSAYETGKISFLDVLDSERMVVRVRLEFESIEARRRIASAKLLKDIGIIYFEEELNNEN